MKCFNLFCMVLEVIKIKLDMEIVEFYLMDDVNKILNISYFFNEVKLRVLYVSQCVCFNNYGCYDFEFFD